MVAALKQRGVSVTYITFAGEGHDFVRPESRLAFDAVAEAFLAETSRRPLSANGQ